MAYDNFIEEHPPWQRLLAEVKGSITGTIEITENGEYDVSSYAVADVNVSGGATFGNLQFSPNFYLMPIAADTYMYPNSVLPCNVFGFGVDGDVFSKIEDGVIPFMPALASGLDIIVTFNYGELLPTIGNAYDVTLVEDGDNMKFATVEEIEVTIAQTTVDWYSESDEPIDAYTVTVPELDANHYLFIGASSE